MRPRSNPSGSLAAVPRAWKWASTLVLSGLFAAGCQVDVPIVVTQQSLDELMACGACVQVPGMDEPETPSDAEVDTIVVTTFRLSQDVDCRSCVERGECAVFQRDCVCLDAPVSLAALREDGVLQEALQTISLDTVGRHDEYCVAIATLQTDGAPGSACACEPSRWEVPTRAAVSCSYSRRASAPSEAGLVINQTVCQNPVASSGVFLPPPDPGGDDSGREPGWTCIYADFFSEALAQCAGLPDRADE